MQYSLFLTFSIAYVAAQQVTALKTDVGSILKSMDQSKLTSIPAAARAVMKKMPEDPTAVTTDDRAAITACIADNAVDALGKEAVRDCAFRKNRSTINGLLLT